jgi:hypothetical protein
LWALNVVNKTGEAVQPTARFSWILLQIEGEERQRRMQNKMEKIEECGRRNEMIR